VIVSAAVVPHPPLLIPELVGGAVAETAQLRAVCEAAAARLVAAGARRWVAVAADESGPRRVPPTATGTFAGYGVDVPVALGSGSGFDAAPDRPPRPTPPSMPPLMPPSMPPPMPLPMLVAGWLRERVGAAEVTGELLHPSVAAAECAVRGRAIADGSSEPVGLLVLGDGAGTHAAPGAGRVDERAGPFDAAVREALAAADTGALLGLDERLAAELGVTGRPGWQVLAGAVEGTGTRWRAELLYSAAPYGVAYHVAVWRPQMAWRPRMARRPRMAQS
jgi:hypothetical protein